MPLWQVSWSHCANPSPELVLLTEGDRLVSETTLFVIGLLSTSILETPRV
jgi:hypothetical protein